jgi:DNA polymerase-1
MKNAVLLIDGHYFLYRSFAVPFKFYSKEKRVPLHVVTTFLKLLRRSVEIVEQIDKLQYICVVFDSQRNNERKKVDDKYKSNRTTDYSNVKDSPFTHYPYVLKLLKHLEVQYIEEEYYEADDHIATLVSKFSDSKVYISSNDTDYFQLINSRIKIIKLMSKNEYLICDSKYLKDKYGITPKHYVLWKSLVGDKADSIAGVPGIGEKRATQIVNGTYKTQTTRKIYSIHKDLIQKNIKLITLKHNLKIKYRTNHLSFNREKLLVPNSRIFIDVNFI